MEEGVRVLLSHWHSTQVTHEALGMEHAGDAHGLEGKGQGKSGGRVNGGGVTVQSVGYEVDNCKKFKE